MYEVDGSEWFDRRCRKLLSAVQQKQLKSVFDSVAENPLRGDPLHSPWFREVRMRDKRLYYVVGNTQVLFVDVSDKKDQQMVIDVYRVKFESLRKSLN